LPSFFGIVKQKSRKGFIFCMYLSVVEKMFQDDVRDKKRTASGIHSCTGKRGYVGKMKFPSDIMSRKDKYNYRKSGKVETSNMYETMIPYFDFKQLPDEQKKQHLQAYRNNFSNKEIIGTWRISQNTFYKIIKELDLPKASRVHKGKSKRTAKPTTTTNTTSKTPVEAYVVEETLPQMVKDQVEANLNSYQEEPDGFGFKIKGTYNTEKLIKRLEKLALILDDEESEFEVDIKIKEKL
jgi:hypothetical protein